MKITRLIWLKRFSEKITLKHRVSGEEVEQLFLNRARFELEERGDIRALVISARDATKRERKRYAKKKV